MAIPTHTLNDGLVVPAIGFGTWPLRGDEAVRTIGSALEVGYRLLDWREDAATVGLTVEWEVVNPVPLDWRQVTFLRDRSGQIVDQTERSLSGAGDAGVVIAASLAIRMFRAGGMLRAARAPTRRLGPRPAACRSQLRVNLEPRQIPVVLMPP